MNITTEIKNCMIFSKLPERDIQEIARIATVKKFGKKELIFSEGDEAKGFYILIFGMVKIYKISPDSREQILHIINPYQTFAEAAIFIGKSYPAFAETILESTAFFFDKERFLKILQNNPQLSLNLIISLSMLLKRVVDLVDDVSLKSVDVRLAEFLLEEAVKRGKKSDGSIEIELTITKTELAKKLGTVNETLSRTLKKLKEKKMITVDRNRIVIHSLEKLQKIKEESRVQL